MVNYRNIIFQFYSAIRALANAERTGNTGYTTGFFCYCPFFAGIAAERDMRSYRDQLDDIFRADFFASSAAGTLAFIYHRKLLRANFQRVKFTSVNAGPKTQAAVFTDLRTAHQ